MKKRRVWHQEILRSAKKFFSEEARKLPGGVFFQPITGTIQRHFIVCHDKNPAAAIVLFIAKLLIVLRAIQPAKIACWRKAPCIRYDRKHKEYVVSCKYSFVYKKTGRDAK